MRAAVKVPSGCLVAAADAFVRCRTASMASDGKVIYNEPLRHPRAPGLSLTRLRLVIPGHALGPPVLRTPLPRRSGWAHCFAHSPQPYQPSPKSLSGRPAHRPFRGLLGVHSRYGLHTCAVTVFRDTLSEGFSH